MLVRPARSLGFVAVLALALVGASSREHLVAVGAVTLQPLMFLGDPAPGGGRYSDYVEIGAMNAEGTAAIAAGVVTPGPEFGEALVLVDRDGQTLVARTGQPIGGATLGSGSLFPISLGDAGALTFSFLVAPFQVPIERSAALFRVSPNTRSTELVAAGGTPTPAGILSGIGFGPHVNDRGVIAFSGLVPASVGPGADLGVGAAVLTIDDRGAISALVRPGEAAPGGGTFDWAAYPYSNDAGDVVFLGHAVEQGACPPPDPDLLCLDAGLYLFQAATSSITTILRPGAYPAVAFARGNAERDVAFVVATAPGQFAAFVQRDGVVRPVALPGDAAPGGGHILRLPPGSSAGNPIHSPNTR